MIQIILERQLVTIFFFLEWLLIVYLLKLLGNLMILCFSKLKPLRNSLPFCSMTIFFIGIASYLGFEWHFLLFKLPHVVGKCLSVKGVQSPISSIVDMKLFVIHVKIKLKNKLNPIKVDVRRPSPIYILLTIVRRATSIVQ